MGYACYAIIGFLLLSLPLCRQHPVGWLDNLFTSVSALSTTGLSTTDLSADYSFTGQMVVLLLIQIGGIGYMTLTSFVMLGLTKHLGEKRHQMFASQFSLPSGFSPSHLIRRIVGFTLGFEVLGVALLYPRFLCIGVDRPLWSAIFHTVSAFCTAGFSLDGQNLMPLRTDYYVCSVIGMLSLMGAMGFIMLTDLAGKIRHGRHHRISFTSKVILRIMTIVTVVTTVHLYCFETSLEDYAPGERLYAAFFHTLMAMTTAGFNTVELSAIVPSTLFIMTLTMYIGAAPSGTGGGLKTTTLSAIYAFTKNKLGLKHDISLMDHIIPPYRVVTALTTFVLYSVVLFVGIYAITLFEPASADVGKISFEASSALATTGLSTGILGDLSAASRFVLIVLMFIGRVGVVTMGHALLVSSNGRKKYTRSDMAV